MSSLAWWAIVWVLVSILAWWVVGNSLSTVIQWGVVYSLETILPAHSHEEGGEGDLLVVEPLQDPQRSVINDVIQVHLLTVLGREPAEDQAHLLQLSGSKLGQFIDQGWEGWLGHEADCLGQLLGEDQKNTSRMNLLPNSSIYKYITWKRVKFCQFGTTKIAELVKVGPLEICKK